MAYAYKMFRISKKDKGKLFPLYVNATKETPIGVWLPAECGERKENGKVKSRLGDLAYRPAWHLTDIPYATHIGVKGPSGKIEYMKENTVWCLCEYTDKVNYQMEADSNGFVNGKFDPKKAYLDKIPYNGFYRYKTNPNMFGTWILAGGMRVVKVLTDAEVDSILIQQGIKPMGRVNGQLNLQAYGF